MVREGRNRNPFRPGAGQMPPYLAGREAELALADRRLGELAGGTAPAQGILFYGPRGNGKTVLLVRIAARARDLGLRAERLSPGALQERSALVEELRELVRRTEARLSGVQLGPVGAAAERAAMTEDVSRLLAAWVQAASAPLVVLLDEAHTMAPKVGRIFLEAVQNAASDDLPFFLIAAGTPDAPRKVRRAGPFAERAFEQWPIGRLGDAATAEALTRPAEEAGRPILGDALELLIGESSNYPYFIQLLGHAAWETAAKTGEPFINLQAAEAAVAAVRIKVERFFMDRFDEAREHRIVRALAPLADLVTRRGGQIGDGELEALLREVAARESVPLRPGLLLLTLRDLGVVWDAVPGVWEMGIPSFADHILRRRGGTRRALR